MNPKIILITGATSGIGQASAFELAKQNHTIIVHGRNKEKTKQLCEEIKKTTRNPNVDFFVADMFLLKDVQKMAEEFMQKYDKLDVLINNAGGIMSENREVTSEGYEKTMAVNLLAPFLLTELLLKLFKNSDDARIINVSSDGHKFCRKPDMNDLQFEKKYAPMDTYVKSKLYLIWVSRHLDKLINRDGATHISINCLHPGNVRTRFYAGNNRGFFLNLIFKLSTPFFISAVKGAETIIYLATSDKVKNISGEYFSKCKISKTNEKYYTAENEKAIRDYCEKITTPYANHLV